MLLARRYEWIEYPAEDSDQILEWDSEHVGIKIKILVNPTMAEVRHETHLYAESIGVDKPMDEIANAQIAYWQYIADRVPEWNLQTEDAKGKTVDVPPPSKNWEVLDQLPFDVAMWLRNSIHLAHRGKVLTRLRERAGTTDTTQPIPLHQAS